MRYLAIDNLGDDMCYKNGISRSLLLFADRMHAHVHTIYTHIYYLLFTYNTTVYAIRVCVRYAEPIEIRKYTDEMPCARTMRLNG